MHIDLVRDPATKFPEIDHPSEVRSLRSWHCKYKSLMRLSAFENIEELAIASVPDASLNFLAPLKRLRYLRVVHMPKVTDIAIIGDLVSLESLSLATSPSWDSSGKKSIVKGFELLAQLQSLRHLELFGVCSMNMSLLPIENCKALLSARFSQYPKPEVERFYGATRVTNEFNPPATFEVQHTH